MSMEARKAEEIIDSVREVYNKVAVPFVASRKRDWSEFEMIIPHVSKGEKLLDVGCAHGRLIPAFLKNEIDVKKYTGIDISENLIKEAKKLFPDTAFEVGNICNLPYQDKMFGTVISSAVLHHIPSHDLRIQALKELARVTKENGKIIILVWNAFYFKHLWLPLCRSVLKSIFSLGKNDPYDLYLSFFGAENIRYVHAFTQGSLKNLLLESGVKKFSIEKTGKNFFIVIQN